MVRPEVCCTALLIHFYYNSIIHFLFYFLSFVVVAQKWVTKKMGRRPAGVLTTPLQFFWNTAGVITGDEGRWSTFLSPSTSLPSSSSSSQLISATSSTTMFFFSHWVSCCQLEVWAIPDGVKLWHESVTCTVQQIIIFTNSILFNLEWHIIFTMRLSPTESAQLVMLHHED